MQRSTGDPFTEFIVHLLNGRGAKTRQDETREVEGERERGSEKQLRELGVSQWRH